MSRAKHGIDALHIENVLSTVSVMREVFGMTRDELAEMAGVHPQTIYNLDRYVSSGRGSPPNWHTVSRLCSALRAVHRRVMEECPDEE